MDVAQRLEKLARAFIKLFRRLISKHRVAELRSLSEVLGQQCAASLKRFRAQNGGFFEWVGLQVVEVLQAADIAPDVLVALEDDWVPVLVEANAAGKHRRLGQSGLST